ncbi:MAG: hypothetical protein GX620_15215 [Chloroflexi bacterium]|nr:hypothetical protein [Chloroflexota bacterium]
MSETLHRLKARIGSLKGVAIITLVILSVALVFDLRLLASALSNPGDPEHVPLHSVALEEVEVGRFVSVSGYAKYDRGYPVYMNGRVQATYYFILDDETRHLIVVRTSTDTFRDRLPQNTTVFGMIREASPRLRELIEADLPAIRASGYQTTSAIFLEEGARPPDSFATFSTAVVLLLCMIPFLTVFLFPSLVFVPMPVDTIWHREQDKNVSHAVRAYGRFFRLDPRNPMPELRGRTRRANFTPVNIKPVGDGRLLVYPLQDARAWSEAVRSGQGDRKRRRRKKLWGIVIDETNFIDIEPGMLYAWQDHWSLRFRYSVGRARPEVLLLAFDNAIAQAECADRLRDLGFTVGMWIA